MPPVGREVAAPLGRPAETVRHPLLLSLEELLQKAKDQSPEMKSKAEMMQGAEAKVQMAEKEYYPDFTLGANLFKRYGIL